LPTGQKGNSTLYLSKNVKKTMNRKESYVKPECNVVQLTMEQLICVVSVRPDASFSSSSLYDDKGEHDVGTILIGDPSTVAPAKQGGLWEEDEKE